MKTIEEKAKAYDESVERAKQIAAQGGASRYLVTQIFPELKESEDERINKAIFKALSKKEARDVLLAEGVQVSDALAYLEKQKEPKPMDNEDPLNDPRFLDGFDTGRDVQKIFDEPAKWSEEDESILNNIIAYRYLNVDDLEWIKKLPKRFNLQPKQEWSEEDEKTYNLLLNHFQQAFEHRTTSLTREEIEKIYDFLKDLRLKKGQIICVDADRIQEYLPRITWKPSEEQMRALGDYIDGEEISEYDMEEIVRLYNDLKKLCQ